MDSGGFLILCYAYNYLSDKYKFSLSQIFPRFVANSLATALDVRGSDCTSGTSAASGYVEMDYLCEFEASEADIVFVAGNDAERRRQWMTASDRRESGIIYNWPARVYDICTWLAQWEKVLI